MTTGVPLPALDGRDPLGFLAALGVLRLITGPHPAARLAFSPATGTAILRSPLAGIGEITAELHAAVSRVPDGSVLEGTGLGFPLRKATRQQARETGTTQKDPMRVPRGTYPGRLRTAVARSCQPAALVWLDALVTDLAVDSTGRAAVTPFNAPSGQQSLWTFFEKPLAAVRDNPGYLTQALTGWRRVPGFTGEYLDHRVLSSAADSPSGKSTEAGVPGATWLAIQALPLFRLTGDGTHVQSTLWHRIAKQQIMIWPLWHQPLDLAAVRVLLEHPVLRPSHHVNGAVELKPGTRQKLEALRVFTVCGAQRVPIDGRKSAGALTPMRVHSP